MKRLTAFAMIILMCFALVACGGQTSADQPAENSTETTQMQQTSDAPQAQPTSSVAQATAEPVVAVVHATKIFSVQTNKNRQYLLLKGITVCFLCFVI